MTLTESDEDLARRAAEGDGRAFETLVRRHAGRILAFCRRLTGDPHEAEDRAQEAFLRAFRALETFDPSRSFGSWLFRIAQNACIDTLRQRKAWSPLADAPEPLAPTPLAPGQAGEVAEAMAELPGKYRAVLHLKYTLGLDAPEVGEHLGMSPGNVRVCLHRAIQTLRKRLNP